MVVNLTLSHNISTQKCSLSPNLNNLDGSAQSVVSLLTNILSLLLLLLHYWRQDPEVESYACSAPDGSLETAVSQPCRPTLILEELTSRESHQRYHQPGETFAFTIAWVADTEVSQPDEKHSHFSHYALWHTFYSWAYLHLEMETGDCEKKRRRKNCEPSEQERRITILC